MGKNRLRFSPFFYIVAGPLLTRAISLIRSFLYKTGRFELAMDIAYYFYKPKTHEAIYNGP